MIVDPIHHLHRPNPIRTVESGDGLNAITEPDIEAVIWDRTIPRSILSDLKQLPVYEVENGRAQLDISAVGAGVINVFAQWGWRIGPAQRWLADDVEALAKHMSTILSVSRVLLRVELVRDDGCRKFHRDTVTARLICTYAGPGTEFCISDGDEPPHVIDSAPTGSPILLKGNLWPGYYERSVSHRSPQIEGSSAARLVVVLNEAT